MLNDIDNNRYRVKSIVTRLADAQDERNRKDILIQLAREGLLSDEQLEKLDELKEVDLPRVVDIVKETKIGQGLKFLPRTLSQLKKRLDSLLSDLVNIGLSSVKKEINALLEELLRRNGISLEQYTAVKQELL